MAQDRKPPVNGEQTPYQKVVGSSYYSLLGVHPSASVREVRQAYRDLSKQYHPDTTTLPRETATRKFQELNEAYATLSSPERRLLYDQKIGYSHVPIAQPLPSLRYPTPTRTPSSSAYLDPTDRPLSAGEVFALFILGMTFLACLVLAIAIGLTRGDAIVPATVQPDILQPVVVQPEITQLEGATPPQIQPTVPESSEPTGISTSSMNSTNSIDSESSTSSITFVPAKDATKPAIDPTADLTEDPPENPQLEGVPVDPLLSPPAS